ncbi:MAG: SulP family inorganic anion transporter [Bacteroidia bacterium]
MFKHLKDDLPASLVVYLVALPLCLGIAIASDAPLFSGMIAGIIGGIIVGSLSGSQISVSGPAAGLAVIVATGLKDFTILVEQGKTDPSGLGLANPFELFLTSVLLAGVFQLIFGYIRAGAIANFIPSSVIHGMLAAIGLLLIFKQVPHALGIDSDFEGDEAFSQHDGQNTITEFLRSFLQFEAGAMIISLVAGLILLVWGHKRLKNHAFFKYVPGALIAVIAGTLLNHFFKSWRPEWVLGESHLVKLPLDAIQGHPEKLIQTPDFKALNHYLTYKTAVVIAIIASLESLLSLEASDKLDIQRRFSSPNRELKAQGIGNMVSGLLGGIPVTAVIVRSSANVIAGARTRLSAVIHGVLLLVSVLVLPGILNMIPKAALAAILILVGYKLISIEVIKANFKKGWNQFIPFVTTIVAIYFTDLLIGIGVGLLVGIIFVIRSNYTIGITYISDHGKHLIKLRDNVTYLNKGVLSKIIEKLPKGAEVMIDGTSARFIDPDIYELIDDFIRSAPEKQISVDLKRKLNSQNLYFQIDGLKFESEK